MLAKRSVTQIIAIMLQVNNLIKHTEYHKQNFLFIIIFFFRNRCIYENKIKFNRYCKILKIFEYLQTFFSMKFIFI